MIIDLNGKTALVTASSKGIGFAISKALAEAGANVCICSRNEETLKAAERELAPERVLAVAGDISEPEFINLLVNKTQQRLGTVDILVNNSGGPPAGEVLSLSEAQWLAAIKSNLLSVIRLSHLALPGLEEKRCA